MTDQFTRALLDRFVDSLVEEVEAMGTLLDGHPIRSVFFGGGTPSVLPVIALERIFSAIQQYFSLSPGCQVSFEGNPDSLSEEKIKFLGRQGCVTRLTIGVQTLDPKTQNLARRFNTPEQVQRAVASARSHGIATINIDLMVGLDGQTEESFARDVEFCLDLEPDALHLGTFRPDPWTGFAQAGKQITSSDRDRRERMKRAASDQLEQRGYVDFIRKSDGDRSAVNRQLDDHKQARASTVALGFPAGGRIHGRVSYSGLQPGGRFYEGLEQYAAGRRQHRVLPSSREVEACRFLMDNFRQGFDINLFSQRFGLLPGEAAAQGWRKLEDLGVVGERSGMIVADAGSDGTALIYRTFLYDAQVLSQIEELIRNGYEPDRSYRSDLRFRYG